jgi:hypothetical protein
MSTHSFQSMVRKSFQMVGQSGDVAGAQMTHAQRSEVPPQFGSYNEDTGCGYLSRPSSLGQPMKQSMLQQLMHFTSSQARLHP